MNMQADPRLRDGCGAGRDVLGVAQEATRGHMNDLRDRLTWGSSSRNPGAVCVRRFMLRAVSAGGRHCRLYSD